MFASLDFLIAFTALNAVSAKLLLPFGFLCGQLRLRQIKAPDELQINLHFLHTISVNLFRGVDDDLVNKLVYHGRGQLRKVGVLLRQRKELLRTVSIFLKAGQTLLRFGNRSDKGFLLRFIFRKQTVKAFIGDPPNSKGFVELFNDVVQLSDALAVFVQLALGFLCCLRLSDLRSGTHLFHKFIWIGDGKGAGCTDGFQNQLSECFCSDIVAAASMGAFLMCQRIRGTVIKVGGVGIVLRAASGTVVGHFRSAVGTEQKSC